MVAPVARGKIKYSFLIYVERLPYVVGVAVSVFWRYYGVGARMSSPALLKK
jgi:hypothetical protein